MTQPPRRYRSRRGQRQALRRAEESGIARPPLERMMHIHQAIARGGYPNASTLARELQVSAKTIQRDVEFLRDRLGLPLAYDDHRWGLYYREEVRAFPTMQLSEGELFSLLIAEKAVQQYRGTPFERPLLTALEKLAAALPDTVSVHLADWDHAISFRTSTEPILNLPLFNLLAQATARHEQLEIVYRKPGRSAPDTRRIDPYHLANINGEWYLFAFDHLRRDLRTFVPARIQSATRTGARFDRPQGFSMDERLRGSFGVHSAEGHFDIVVRFSPAAADYIREKRWHPSQSLRDLPRGGVQLQLRLSSLAEVQRWILGWGGQATVLAPPELVRSVRKAAQAILRSQPRATAPRMWLRSSERGADRSTRGLVR